MAQRLELQALLKKILGSDSVYFQPPTNVRLEYPCIVYERSQTNVDFADNKPYRHKKRYTLTLIDRNPDTPFVDSISALPLCIHDRFFTADNLNHDVFTLYF
jgi:hypothetical protein